MGARRPDFQDQLVPDAWPVVMGAPVRNNNRRSQSGGTETLTWPGGQSHTKQMGQDSFKSDGAGDPEPHLKLFHTLLKELDPDRLDGRHQDCTYN